jgi:tight adherence protein B
MTTGTVNRSRIEPRPEFAKIVRIDESYTVPGSASAGALINGWFDSLIVQSGTAAAPAVILQLCILGAVACGGTVFVATNNLLATAVCVAIGALGPIATLAVTRWRRQRTIRRQLPVLIAGLTQAARQGRGLAAGLEAAAADRLAPLSDEIGMVLRRLRMGIDVEAAFEGLVQRTGVPALNVLVSALALHDRTGADLEPLLERAARRIALGD